MHNQGREKVKDQFIIAPKPFLFFIYIKNPIQLHFRRLTVENLMIFHVACETLWFSSGNESEIAINVLVNHGETRRLIGKFEILG